MTIEETQGSEPEVRVRMISTTTYEAVLPRSATEPLVDQAMAEYMVDHGQAVSIINEFEVDHGQEVDHG